MLSAAGNREGSSFFHKPFDRFQASLRYNRTKTPIRQDGSVHIGINDNILKVHKSIIQVFLKKNSIYFKPSKIYTYLGGNTHGKEKAAESSGTGTKQKK